MSILPVVDYTSPTASEAFFESLVETGFAVLKNHPVPESLIDSIYAGWQRFFLSEQKHDFAFDPKTHQGFVSTAQSETAKGSSIKDLKEFYHYFFQGRCPDDLCQLTETFYVAMNDFAQQLLAQVEQRLPSTVREALSEPLASMIEDSTLTLLRLIHYPPLETALEPGAVRAAAHEDIDLLTLLPAATAKGLQVQLKDGRWLDVPCQRGWMIINVGDMLQECTQGYLRATSHRVINPDGEAALQSRVSCPLFLHPRNEVVLSSRHTAGSYLDERLAELGLA